MGGSRIPSYLLRSNVYTPKGTDPGYKDELVYPIIHGYNVIEETIRNKWQGGSKGAIFDIMSFALVDVNVKSVSALVEFEQGQMKKACVFEEWYINSLTVPAGQKVGVPCYVSCGPLERRRWQP